MTEPSSISSSDRGVAAERVPVLAWGRTWLVALGLAAAVLATWEAAGRIAGFRPYVSDDAGLWSLWRSRVPPDDPRALVLAGRSRMLVGVDLDVVRGATAVAPVQLAIGGASAVPVIRDLARDPTFRGRVVAEFVEDDVLGRNAEAAEELVRYHRERPFSAHFERRLRLLVEEHLVSRSPQLAPRPVAMALVSGRRPPAAAVESRADRARPTDYTRMDTAALRSSGVERVVRDSALHRTPPVAEFLRAAADVEALITQIHQRGGRVVLVRFPTGGRRWDLEEARFPKRVYWDAFSARTAARTVHFKDHAELARYDLPDWSHLDRRDAGRFTRALLAVIADDLR